MIGPLVLAALALSALAALIRRLLRSDPAHAVIVSPPMSTVIARDGAVRSKQSAHLTLDKADFDRIWTPANLENLARTYWLFLTRVTLGLIRVVYSADSRSVVLLFEPITLLRFEAPEYTIEDGHRGVKWHIRDGLLVTRSGRGSGYLAVGVSRQPDRSDGRVQLLIEVEVANFYPSIAKRLSTPVYEMTQSAVHVLVTHAFLRSLARLDLKKSKVGLLADTESDLGEPPIRSG